MVCKVSRSETSDLRSHETQHNTTQQRRPTATNHQHGAPITAAASAIARSHIHSFSASRRSREPLAPCSPPPAARPHRRLAPPGRQRRCASLSQCRVPPSPVDSSRVLQQFVKGIVAQEGRDLVLGDRTGLEVAGFLHHPVPIMNGKPKPYRVFPS